MPEISSVMPLCQILQINVNELLSGERLPEHDYSRKAEENIMNLIQETEQTKKKNRNSLCIIIVTVLTVILGTGYFILSNAGLKAGAMFFDATTLLILAVVTILFLAGTGLLRPFLQAFLIVIGRKQDAAESEIVRADAAVWLAGNTFLFTGILQSIIGFITIAFDNIGSALPAESLGAPLWAASFGILYGVIGFLLLLPIKAKLQAMKSDH